VEDVVGEVPLEIVQRGLDLLLVLHPKHPPDQQLRLELRRIVSIIFVAESVEERGHLGRLPIRGFEKSEEQAQRMGELAEVSPSTGHPFDFFKALEAGPERLDGRDVRNGFIEPGDDLFFGEVVDVAEVGTCRCNLGALLISHLRHAAVRRGGSARHPGRLRPRSDSSCSGSAAPLTFERMRRGCRR